MTNKKRAVPDITLCPTPLLIQQGGTPFLLQPLWREPTRVAHQAHAQATDMCLLLITLRACSGRATTAWRLPATAVSDNAVDEIAG